MISIVIPVYNAEKYLRQTVASVQAQTFPDWEIVLMDDGSTDSSPEIAAALCREDSRISSLRQANAGASAARNHGIEKSNPDFPYVLCLDSDDLLLPDALQRLRALLELNPQSPAACGFLQDIDAEGQVIPFARLESLVQRHGVSGLRLVRRQPGAPVVFGDLCFHNHIVTPGQVLVRKDAVARIGAFDLSLVYIEDYDLWWRLAMKEGAIAVTSEPVMLYRHHETSLSSNKAITRSGATNFRWLLLTYPGMSSEQKQIAKISCFYNCLATMGFAATHLRRGNTKTALKYAALSVRDMLYFLRDLIRAQRQAVPVK